MPALTNVKHERFARAITKGLTQGEAYISAGYDVERLVADACSSRLLRKANIQARIVELQNKGAERAEVSIQSLIQEAADIQDAALEAGQHSAAVAALTAKAKLSGLWVEKTENRNRNVDANSLSDGELAAHIKSNGGTHPSQSPVDTSKLN